jgi:hypothetical protein
MKQLLFKLGITSGLLVTGLGFSQTALEDELMLQPGESLLDSSWRSEFKPSPNDLDYISTKTYGEANGYYYVYLPASGASPYDKSSTYVYGGSGCIYRNTPSGSWYELQLQMPDDHQLIGFRYYYSDNSASQSTAFLYTVDNSGNYVSELSISSTGNSGYGTIYNVMPTTMLVDNFNYRYTLRFYSSENSSNQEICGVRLFMDSTP